MSEPAWVPLGSAALAQGNAIGTVLPPSPVDGQRFILTDSLTAPTYAWNLIYVAAKASNRWVCVGGSPAVSEVLTSETTASTSYVDLATVGPQFTVPVAGDYIYVGSCWLATSTAGQFAQAALKVGAAAASDDDAMLATSSAANTLTTTSKTRKLSGVAASALLKMQYKVGAGTGTFIRRVLMVTPVALGG